MVNTERQDIFYIKRQVFFLLELSFAFVVIRAASKDNYTTYYLIQSPAEFFTHHLSLQKLQRKQIVLCN